VEERVRIGRTPIPVHPFCRILTRLKITIEELIDSKILLSPPTYFELLTCLALTYFQEQKVDIAVLEVGMGGRFDATNVVDPLVTVITTISEEHQKFLGETLAQIAFEKAGIIRADVPVVCGVERKEAFLTIKKRAKELGAPFFAVFKRKGCFIIRKRRRDYRFEYRSDEGKYRYSPSLPGEHQGKNAAVAIASSERLHENWRKLHKEKIIQAIETTRWEGRLEAISSSPLVLLDGAHNEEGALALRSYIRDFIPSPIILVFASMRDKKIEKIADILFPLSRMVILTRFPFFKGALPEEIQERVSKFEDRLLLEADPMKALLMALKNAAPGECVLVTGSLYVVGEIKKYFPQGIKKTDFAPLLKHS
jgi:dihydrofolate synthase/folylpolyglutamate synthase